MGSKDKPAAPPPPPPAPPPIDIEALTQLANQQSAAMTQAMEDAASAAKKAAEEARIAAGVQQTGDAYSNYLTAAGAAADYVNAEITSEQANADLLGIHYDMTDDMKSTRINDYFATIWSEGDQRTLDQLMQEFGEPEGFQGFSVVRGDGSVYADADADPGPGETSDASTGRRPTLIAPEEEDTLDNTTILGAPV